MSVEIANVHPTRLELLKLKRRKAMAEGIVDILKKDLDALTVALFDLAKEVPSIRRQMTSGLSEAYDLYVESEMVVGPRKIKELSIIAQPTGFHVDIGERKGILGISLPTFELAKETSSELRPRFSLMDSPAKLDASASQIEAVLSKAIELAQIEASMHEVLDLMAIKKRQVNRIQYKILPQLDSAIRYIELILEETERQDAIRVRVLQRKRKERALKAG
ncbi:MAG: V-type ATP synthase subunit D [Candidatus Bathyarchaeota archaeon]|nr:MAG: V-type ATP synthase subunit D [Candidatus Bathyarchaeota archaeon]